MEKIKILKKILNANDAVAESLRNELKRRGIFLVNLMGSPGAGKTVIIERTIREMREMKFAVIEGDIETTMDAERLARLNIQVSQINTGPFGGDCHLEASWIASAIHNINLENVDIIFIENIGNLVCPAEFDTGSHINVVVLSIPEGEDKPLKYPLMFRKSNVVLINKIDLLPYIDLSLETLEKNIKKVNPSIKTIRLSGKTGKNFGVWEELLRNKWKEIK